MENLKKQIQNNSHLFDIYEPEAGHLDRFKSKLHKPKSKKSIYWIISAAAMVLLFFSLSFLFTNNPEWRNLPQLSDISKEYKEAEYFYQVEINDKLTQLETLNCTLITADSSIYKELNVLDQEYINLRRDLVITNYDERIVSAMIHNYQIRISLLESVIKGAREFCY